MSGKVVDIPIRPVRLPGELTLVPRVHGMVVFTHGAGGSRLSPRNRRVAEILQEKGLSTLLFDLLTEEEDAVYANRFNIGLLSHRLLGATRWLIGQQEGGGLPVGYFGASTGAAAALLASLQLGDKVRAIVCRGGRPDLVYDVLPHVTAPTLLLVGRNDHPVRALNRRAYDQLTSEKALEIVPGAGHLFEEPGALEHVAQRASGWFSQHLKV